MTHASRAISPVRGQLGEGDKVATRGRATMRPAAAATSDTELVTETLVEEVSIDGMCGVY